MQKTHQEKSIKFHIEILSGTDFQVQRAVDPMKAFLASDNAEKDIVFAPNSTLNGK
jgi:hypothetical protein